MSLVDELHRELGSDFVDGIQDGKKENLEEAPVFARAIGIKNPNYLPFSQPTYVGPMPHPILGMTAINPDGEVGYVKINSNIPLWVAKAARTYNKGKEWAKRTAYKLGKLVTDHEYTHAFTSKVVKGESFNKNTEDVMETLTTYAKHLVAKMLDKREKAELIKETNPYPVAWRIGQLADLVPYTGPSGEGYAALIRDAQTEPFYKPLWRLSKAAAKAAIRKGKSYLGGTGVPQYVPQASR